MSNCNNNWSISYTNSFYVNIPLTQQMPIFVATCAAYAHVYDEFDNKLIENNVVFL